MQPPGADIVIRSVEPMLDGRGDTGASACANCTAPLQGPYCAQCGQKAGHLEITLAAFVREAFDNLFSFDSRLWSTLRPLIGKPGFLTAEYLNGRRARYMPPLRMYLFVSFVTFLSMGLLHAVRPEVDLPMVTAGGGASSSEPLSAGEVDWEEDARDEPAVIRWLMLEVIRPAVEEPDRTRSAFVRRLPWAVFCLVPVLALLLRLAYRRRQAFFVPHLVFSLHLHTFAFVLMTVGFLYHLIAGSDHLGPALNLWIVIAFFLGLRRVYADGRMRTLVKMFGVSFFYLLALAFAMLVSFLLTGLGN